MRDIESEKQALFHQVAAQLQQQGFSITKEDPARPWGGFLVIDEDQASSFADAYFNGLSVDE
ncbi:MAG TPA: phosphoheptose isomerase, partial [Hymenobacter sp.]